MAKLMKIARQHGFEATNCGDYIIIYIPVLDTKTGKFFTEAIPAGNVKELLQVLGY